MSLLSLREAGGVVGSCGPCPAGKILTSKIFFTIALIVTLTGYCDENGMPPWGITASGKPTREGVAACFGWRYGTVFKVEEIGRLVCWDRGGAVQRLDQLDVWFSTCEEATEFGVRKRWVWITRKKIR